MFPEDRLRTFITLIFIITAADPLPPGRIEEGFPPESDTTQHVDFNRAAILATINDVFREGIHVQLQLLPYLLAVCYMFL